MQFPNYQKKTFCNPTFVFDIWAKGTFPPTLEGDIEAVARLHGCLTGCTLVVSF